MNPHPVTAFTLIELLVVVAILAVLAAIAVPNMLEARTRSLVARATSDMRALATALESYAVDNRARYPAYGNPMDAALFAGEPIVFVPVRLTTPIAYISSLPPDPFPGRRSGIDPGRTTTFFYMHNYPTIYLGKTQEAGHVSDHYRQLTGDTRFVSWTLWSYGPDAKDDHGVVLYDATNGTVSRGDLMRFGP